MAPRKPYPSDISREPLESIRPILEGVHGPPFAGGAMEHIDATVQVVKRNEVQSFVVLPKRWIVERSFAWLEKCRPANSPLGFP